MVSCSWRPTLLSRALLAPPLCPLFPRIRFCNSAIIKHSSDPRNRSNGLKFHRSECTFLLKRRLQVTVSAMDAPPPGYRPNVGICLISPAKKVFVASRLDVPGAWQMPQGGVDEGEEPKAAAIRELHEETGVVSAEIIAEVPQWLTYDFPPAVKEKIDRLWGGDWKGQAQKWFLFKFTGNEKEINIAGDGTEAAEFSEWTWMLPDQVIEQAVDFKRPVYEQVFTLFAPHLGAEPAGQ